MFLDLTETLPLLMPAMENNLPIMDLGLMERMEGMVKQVRVGAMF